MSSKKNRMPKTAAARFSAVKITNDLMMNRLMLAFVLAVVAITVVMCVRNATDVWTMNETVGKVMMCVFAALFGASFGVFLYRFINKKNDADKAVTKYNILGCGVLALICAVFYALKPSLASVCSVIVVLVALVLYFIWYIYPASFFMLSLFTAAESFLFYAAFGLEAVRLSRVIVLTVLRAAAILLPVLFAIGVLVFRKKRRISLPGPMLLLFAVLALAGSVLLMLSVPYLSVLLVFCGFYIGVAVYCTVHMI